MKKRWRLPGAIARPTPSLADFVPFRFKLPWPPSVNELWRSPNKGRLAGRILKSSTARTYQAAVGRALLAQQVPRNYIGRPVTIEVTQYARSMRGDPDNGLKAMLDAMVHCGVLATDTRAVVKLLIVQQGELDKPNGSLIVMVRPWP